jgi:glycosyltransferase involved in cell wall biosynthesis
MNRFLRLYRYYKRLGIKQILRIVWDSWLVIDREYYRSNLVRGIAPFPKLHFLLVGQKKLLSPNEYFDASEYVERITGRPIAKKFPLFHYMYFSNGTNPVTAWDRQYLEYAPEARTYLRSVLLHYYLHSDKSFAIHYSKRHETQKSLTNTLLSVQSSVLEEVDAVPIKIEVQINSCEQCLIIPSLNQISLTFEKMRHEKISKCNEKSMRISRFNESQIYLEIHEAIVLEQLELLKILKHKSSFDWQILKEKIEDYLNSRNNILGSFDSTGTKNFDTFEFDTSFTNHSSHMKKELVNVTSRLTGLVKVKRVLLVSHEDSRTGAPIYLAQIAKSLQENDYAVHILSIRDDVSAGVFSDQNLTHHYLRDFVPNHSPADQVVSNWIFTPNGEKAFERLLQKFQPDLVFVNSLASSDILRLCIKSELATVLYVHENISFFDPDKKSLISPNLPVLEALEASSRVIFGSIATKDFWVNRVSIVDYRVIPSYRSIVAAKEGVRAALRSEFRSQLNIGVADLVFISIGTFEKRKRITDIIEAFQRLENEDIKLILVGEPEIPNDVSLEARKLVKGDKRIHIFKSQHNLDRFYAASDVLVHASSEETMPLVIQEAAIWGLARIVSRYEGVQELVIDEETGMLFEVGDIEELQIKMKYILDQPRLLTKMALKSHSVQMENLRLGISLVKELLEEIPLGSLSVVPIDWLKR